MSKLGSLYIQLGEPEGELAGCCETAEWAADYIESLRQQLADAESSRRFAHSMFDSQLIRADNSQKRKMMLRNALALIAQTATLDTYRIASGALAATADLDKYVLCEKEPKP